MKPPSKPAFVCASCARMLRNRFSVVATAPLARPAAFSTTTTPAAGADATSIDPQLPRYRQTPLAMKMPYRLRPQPNQPVWRVNQDAEALNAVYDKLLSRVGGNNVRGRDLLDDETKWLAVTHKSFDHGRQGFNDRLAFLGKRVVELQASLALLNGPTMAAGAAAAGTMVGNEAVHDVRGGGGEVLDDNDGLHGGDYQHPALEGLENVTAFAKHATLSPGRLAALASTYGLDKVVRWKPRRSDNLRTSGVDVVMAHALLSVIGALAMRNGGEVAAKAARERILHPLGLR